MLDEKNAADFERIAAKILTALENSGTDTRPTSSDTSD
jgi:hypothetical protein